MFKASPPSFMFGSTPILYKKQKFNTGVNQYGLKMDGHYDKQNPTNLINFGKRTTMQNLDVRRGDGMAPSMDGLPLQNVAPMFGLDTKAPTSQRLTFCHQETAALRVCMARGVTDCAQEDRMLQACLGAVSPVRGAIAQASSDWVDWMHQNVSDNRTKPFLHRRHDNREVAAENLKERWRVQNFIAYGKHPKRLAYSKQFREGATWRSRMPANR